ncbi:MAG: FkbM family methyltransferase [Candidatus Binataceae bacterium]
MKWIAAAGIHKCWLGTYEREKQDQIVKYLHPGMTVYDIGAHSGFYTLLFSRLVGSQGTVYSFEPCPQGMWFLLQHARLNALNNVRVIQTAVSDAAGLYPMSIDFDSYTNRLCARDQTPLLVATISIDTFDGHPPDLIKIDVEGAETAVLRGATKTLGESRPVIFLALHGADRGRECAVILRDSDYTLYTLNGALAGDSITTDEIIALPKQPGPTRAW